MKVRSMLVTAVGLLAVLAGLTVAESASASVVVAAARSSEDPAASPEPAPSEEPARPFDVTDLPALPVGDLPSMVPQVPVGESEPARPLPDRTIYDTSTAPNAPAPKFDVSPEAAAWLLAAKDSVVGKFTRPDGAREAQDSTSQNIAASDPTSADVAETGPLRTMIGPVLVQRPASAPGVPYASRGWIRVGMYGRY
ncbi:hypothetical protein [Microbacterium capsulatum]|nr:hypothetical protein [Microbacterium sp. ASV81]